MRGVLRCFLVALAISSASAVGAGASSLPNQTTTRQATTFELWRDGKTAGRLELPAGEKLDVIDVKEHFVLVRYRNLNGRVPLSDTTLPSALTSPPASSPAIAPVNGATPHAVSAPSPSPETATARTDYVPATPMELMLADKLVVLQGSALRPFATARLAGVKFYAIYFSAGWCPPCREFTPEFMDAYTKIRAVYPEFEVVLVNRDRSPAAMFEYMRDDQMKWPALRWDLVRGARELNRYAGAGIPCLVLVDETGRVLSDSYRWGNYVGPDAVLDDTWKLLRDYRRKNPRPKT